MDNEHADIKEKAAKAIEMKRIFERGKEYGDITVSLQSKRPHRTCSLVIWYPEGDFPEELEADLVENDWEDIGSPMPPMDGRNEKIFFKKGNGIFCGWTDEERKENLKEIRGILRRHGIVSPPMIRLRLQDLL